MFTGIIQQIGKIASIESASHGIDLRIDASGWAYRPEIGDSIAVNGCCLTLSRPVQKAGGLLCFDIVPQTLRTTTLGESSPGDRVNLEPALRADSIMSGHIVQGHVDGVASVTDVVNSTGERRIRIHPPPELMPYICEKGSISVNGVSLTIADLDESSFEAALIPTTLNLTNLNELTAGSSVNLEVDAIARIVVSWLARYAGLAPSPGGAR